jgi:cell surface protein SprA
VELTPFPRIPLPNWSVNYNGLTSLPGLKKYFTSVTLRHTYRGTYSVGTFNNNLNARDLDGDGIPDNYAVTTLDPITGQEIRNYYAIENIQGVQITEQFAPLLGLNLNFKNGLTSQIDYKRGRQFLLNVGGLQLTETRNEDVAVMVGYRKDKMNLNFRFFGRDISMKNSMNFQFQATLRDLREANHSLSQTGSTTDPTLGTLTTRGALNVIVRPSVDYVVNTRINVKVFFEHNMNRPHTAQAYNTSFTSGGVQLRFSLAQ